MGFFHGRNHPFWDTSISGKHHTEEASWHVMGCGTSLSYSWPKDSSISPTCDTSGMLIGEMDFTSIGIRGSKVPKHVKSWWISTWFLSQFLSQKVWVSRLRDDLKLRRHGVVPGDLHVGNVGWYNPPTHLAENGPFIEDLPFEMGW